MTIDRTTKGLLFAIALGLWLHVAGDWMRSTPVHAQNILGDPQLASIDMHLKNISVDTASISVSLKSLVTADALRRR